MIPEGNAIVYCEGAFQSSYGKTAHGLVRHTERYNVLSVVDSLSAGMDAGELLDGKHAGIPIYGDIREATEGAAKKGLAPTHLLIGIASDGGGIDNCIRSAVFDAIHFGMNVDSGLHEFLNDISELRTLAAEKGLTLRDIRKPPPRSKLHFFTGKINNVTSLKIAVLGSDSAIGKRTTAWKIIQNLKSHGRSSELIGTGQTAWMQGADYSIILDSLINDFVSGEIENIVWSAWRDKNPEFIVIEGQGSLMNPGYPGGFEILAAGRPDGIVLQHAPGRKEYDGFPGYPIHPLDQQIHAIEFLSGRPVEDKRG